MEEKLKRECKPWLEKLFKQNDELGAGAVSMEGMSKILRIMIPEFDHDEELKELMVPVAKRAKYTRLNKQTNQFEVDYLENSVDFPSALYLCVYFLKKIEYKDSNNFSGRSVVKFNDLPGMNLNPVEAKKKACPEQAHLRRYF